MTWHSATNFMAVRRFSSLFRYVLCVIAFSWPLESQANTGVPLFLNYVFYAWLLLIPIIGIEAYVLVKRLDIPVARGIRIAFVVNIASTFLGSVIVIVVSSTLALMGLQEAPGARSDVSILFALIPCFFLSVWFETLIGYPYLKQHSREHVWAVFFLANEFTYALLAIVPIANLIKNAIISGQAMWY